MALLTQPKEVKYKIILTVVLSVIFTTIFILMIFPILTEYLGSLSVTELVAFIAVLVSIVGITWQIILYKIKNVPSVNIELIVEISTQKRVIITTKIINVGGSVVQPKHIYLLIDEGLQKEKRIEFPKLTEHIKGKSGVLDEYCQLVKFCQDAGVSYPNHLIADEFKDLYHDCLRLNHLSDSILYIAPGEYFSEDVVFAMPKKGVYRVIVILIPKNADCVCTNKQLIIVDD